MVLTTVSCVAALWALIACTSSFVAMGNVEPVDGAERTYAVPAILWTHGLNVEWWEDVAQRFGLHVFDTNFAKQQFIFEWAKSPNGTDMSGAELGDILRFNGYHQFVPSDLPDWQLNHTAMRQVMDFLYENSIPQVYSFMFDEFWYVFMRLHAVISCALETTRDGYWRLTDMWAWRVDATTRETGWSLHRDMPNTAIDAQGTLNAVTVWVPLGDVTTHHSCMHILPVQADSSYVNPDAVTKKEALMRSFNSVRALPVQQGGVLMWNQVRDDE